MQMDQVLNFYILQLLFLNINQILIMNLISIDMCCFNINQLILFIIIIGIHDLIIC
jgi:hypothetical protein